MGRSKTRESILFRTVILTCISEQRKSLKDLLEDLKHPELLGKQQDLWQNFLTDVLFDESCAEDRFFKGLYTSRRISRNFGKELAKKRREKEKILHEALAAAQLALETAPDDIRHQTDLVEAEGNLKEFLEIKSDWIMEAAKVKWLNTDSQCPTFVCNTFKQQAVAKDISRLKDDRGNIVSDWMGVSEIARNHFIKLFGTAP